MNVRNVTKMLAERMSKKYRVAAQSFRDLGVVVAFMRSCGCLYADSVRIRANHNSKIAEKD